MKNYKCFLMIAGLFALSLAEKEVGGILNRDTRWKAEDGPFLVTADILIAAGTRLTISPGVVILIKNPLVNDTLIRQLDNNDASMISIKVEGTLSCVGKTNKRIEFLPDTTINNHRTWYGIVLNKVEEQFTDIAFTDISGAYCGVTVTSCAPMIRNTLIEYNHIGIYCIDHGSANIFNCIIAYNRNVGIRSINSNPRLTNNIIVSNRNNGIWCDGVSMISLTYNCIFGNNDGNIIECDPDLGRAVKKNGQGDSIDMFNNILGDPVFSGSVAEINAEKKDIALPTEKISIRNHLIAGIIHGSSKETASQLRTEKDRYHLSKYSPCSNAGDPANKFLDKDGSRNDMGIYGGPDFIEK